MPETERQRMVRQHMGMAASAAFTAMSFVISPEIWPAFAAWAERQIPDDIFTREDRQFMVKAARIMQELAEVCDE